ncbi:MAG: glycosyltransferase family 2 protein [Planctomycetaceae bacterium]
MPASKPATIGLTSSLANLPELPLVSVIVPIRNESGYIEGCLRSIQLSDWPTDRMEIVVVDGMSTDDTVEVVERMMRTDARIRLLTNPARVQTSAMNIGIREARGDIILRVDGHAEVLPDYVRNSVSELVRRPECWCVGGVVETINDTEIGHIIAAAQSCPVGVGNSRFRIGGDAGYADTVPFGAYWKWVFERIGLYDEELVRNEDDELNARLLQNGGKIFLTPRIRSRYFSRSTLRKLWNQYYQYGVWRIRTIQKRGSASLRYMVPMVFVTAAVAATAAAILSPALRPLSMAFALAYLTALLIGAVMVGRRTGFAGFLLAPVVFATLHFSYGFGSLFGIFWFGILRRRTLRHGMSR